MPAATMTQSTGMAVAGGSLIDEIVRNGRAEPRQVLTSAGAVEVTAPRVNDKRLDEVTGERRRFGSMILPAWCRKSPKVNEVLPLLYLHRASNRAAAA